MQKRDAILSESSVGSLVLEPELAEAVREVIGAAESAGALLG
jgi:hypothetical protein